MEVHLLFAYRHGKKKAGSEVLTLDPSLFVALFLLSLISKMNNKGTGKE